MHFRRPLSQDNGGSRPSDRGGGGAGHLDPEIRGSASPKKFFPAFWASVWSKNKRGAGPRAPPLDPPLQDTCGRWGEASRRKKSPLSNKTDTCTIAICIILSSFFLDLAGYKTNRGHWASHQ